MAQRHWHSVVRAVVGQEMKPDLVALGQPALSLLDVIPVVAHATTEFAYMRQTVRTNNAAVVAEGAVKPTSVYSVNKIPNSLAVVAHLSEAIPRFWLIDQVSLDTFVSSELEYGLRLAVESKVLTDVNATSGIQLQAYATTVLTVLRKSITKLETARPSRTAGAKRVVAHPGANGDHADAEALGGLADLEKRGQARHPPRAASAASTPAGASEARIRSCMRTG